MARGLIACALLGEKGEVYNLASGVETIIIDLAKMINKITGNKTPLEIKPARDWDRSGKRFGDIEKSKKILNFEAKISMEQGLEETINWTKEQLGNILQKMLIHERFVPEIKKYVK